MFQAANKAQVSKTSKVKTAANNNQITDMSPTEIRNAALLRFGKARVLADVL